MRLQGIYKEKSSWIKVILMFSLIFCSSMVHILIATGILSLSVEGGLQVLSSQDISSDKSINILKFMQFFIGVGLFITPTLLYAYLTGYNFKLRAPFTKQMILITVAIILLINPFINFLYEWNRSINFPEWIIDYEIKAEELTGAFMHMTTFWDLGINLIVISVVPAIGEELFFRGYLQQSCRKWFGQIHLAIFITAILFSAIHMQFQGFFPRFVLGLILGYLFYWSNSLWVPIIMHFINNALAIIFSYSLFERYSDIIEGTSSCGEALFSFFSVVLLCFLFYTSSRNSTKK